MAKKTNDCFLLFCKIHSRIQYMHSIRSLESTNLKDVSRKKTLLATLCLLEIALAKQKKEAL